MKKIYFLYFTILLLIVSSCGSSGFVNLNYPREPQVLLPEGINNILVVNRSLTREGDKKSEKLESIVTGEIAGSDKLASDEAIKGAFDGIRNSNHIKIILADTLRIYGTGTRQMPELLNWKKVSEMCNNANADALLVLETFDSNTDLVRTAVAQQVSSVFVNGKPTQVLPQRVRVDVKSYWRLYDPHTKIISDQFSQTFYMNFNLVNGLPPVGALYETAYAAGIEYTTRFLPSYYKVRRDMYKKGKGRDKDHFSAGWRSAEVAKWHDAIAIWKDILENRGSSAGMAALNIAVAYEVLGDTDLALQYAQLAYKDYGDKLSRDYAKILLRRKRLQG